MDSHYYKASPPQTIYSFPNLREGGLGDFDLIVVDEAHNYYLVDDGMLQSIISKTNHSSELLLTASPSKFIAKNYSLTSEEKYNIISFASSNLVKHKVIIDPKIILLETKEYKFNIKDYFSKDEIKKRKIDPNITKNVLKETLEFLKREYTHNNFKKGMIVASDEQHAFEVNSILAELKIPSLISTYSFDPESIKIEQFKTDEKYQVLVVVQRGVLGFDYPDLECVIDLSFSLNPDRLFQMINRVVRVSNSKDKLFVKIMPSDLIEFAEISLSCASALSLKEVFDNYSGNYRDMAVPIWTEKENARQNSVAALDGDSEYVPRIHYIPNFFVMNLIYSEEKERKKIGKDVNLYAWTSFNETKEKYLIKARLWSLEKCKQIALNYKRICDWSRNDKLSYSAAIYHGWVPECTMHMIKKKSCWNFEECKAISLKYNRPVDWMRNNKSSYQAANSKGWLKELTAHMDKALYNYWTFERCKEIALQYHRPVDWMNNHQSSYSAAKKNKWLCELTTHMQRAKFNFWTKDACLEEANKYHKQIDWFKNSRGSFQAAKKNGWIKECSEHMQKIKHWCLEDCQQEALKYKRRSDWQQASPHSYGKAARKGWLSECCAHMENKLWTFEKCKIEALKYNTIRDWHTNNKSSYNAACKNAWIKECTRHMKRQKETWSLEKCKSIDLQFKHPVDWIKAHKNSYKVASANKWLKDCTMHMEKN